MQDWVMVVWGGWLLVSLIPWQLSHCRHMATACGTSMASSHRPSKVDIRLGNMITGAEVQITP